VPEATGSASRPANAAQAELARLDAQRMHLGRELQLGTIVSPISGMITTPDRELKERVGQQVSRGELLADVHDVRKVTAEIPISEKEIAEVRVGQPVVLRTRAYPNRVFEGRVTSIAAAVRGPETEATTGAAIAPLAPGQSRTIRVTTELDNASLLLKPEMTGKAKILCGKRSMLDLATRRIARTLKVEVWSWW
jgi:multidrug resistance efflux pump